MTLESAAYFGLSESPDLSYFKPAFKQISKDGDGSRGDADSRTVLDTSALLYDLYREVQKGESSLFSKNQLAAMFVHAFSIGIGSLVLEQSLKTGIQTVCISGGVANNDYIVSVLSKMMKENGLTVLTHKNLPPGDGCISHGQVASVTARLLADDEKK